jgi:hypothetical protein
MQLDDTDRTVEVVSAGGIGWQVTGRAMEVATWLGNATEHDRQQVMEAAREAAPGSCLKVSFPSVMTFYLGYAGQGAYRICVPE